jgi:hypothetical protein
MSQRLSREQKEMAALMKRIQKAVPKRPTDDSDDSEETKKKKKKHFVDRSAEKDWDVKDVEADVLFREMKRRDF